MRRRRRSESATVKGRLELEGGHIFHLDLTDCSTHFTLAIYHGGAAVGFNRRVFDTTCVFVSMWHSLDIGLGKGSLSEALFSSASITAQFANRFLG